MICRNCKMVFTQEFDICPRCYAPSARDVRLIKCPECSFEFLSNFEVCPKCGYILLWPGTIKPDGIQETEQN